MFIFTISKKRGSGKQLIKLVACRQGNVPKPAERKFGKRYAAFLTRLIYIFTLLITTSFYQAQTGGFYKSYDVKTKSDFTETSDIILTNDSCFALACTSYDSSMASVTIEIFKINSSGTMLWRQTFLCPTATFYTNIIQTPDSGFVITASCDYPADTTIKVIIIKTNKLGTKQWIKLLGDNKLSQFNRDTQIKGNSIFLLSHGSIKLPGNMYQNAYFVTKMDLLGNIEWYKYYNWVGAPYPKSFVITNKKELFVSGEINNLGNVQFALSKIDSSSNLIWSKVYSPFSDVDPLHMIQDTAGNLLFTGHKWISAANGWDIFLMKIDSIGNFKWGKTYGGTSDDEGWSVFQSNSDYVICAEPESFVTSRASLIKTDSVGNIKWMKIYGDATGSFPNGALQLKSGYIIYGIKGNYAANTRIYLLKTDHNGIAPCKWNTVSLPATPFTLTASNTGTTGLVQGIMSYSLTEIVRPINDYEFCVVNSIDDINNLTKNLKIYPNPNSGTFKLSIDIAVENCEIVIFNALGQKVHQQKIITGTNNIITNDLAKGLFNYAILLNKQTINYGKVTVE